MGLQEKPFKLVAWVMVTVPPFADVGSAFPLASAEVPLASWTNEDVLLVEADRVSVTVATILFGTAVVFWPHKMHLAVRAPLTQETVFFAVVAPGPAATVADTKSVVE